MWTNNFKPEADKPGLSATSKAHWLDIVRFRLKFDDDHKVKNDLPIIESSPGLI